MTLLLELLGQPDDSIAIVDALGSHRWGAIDARARAVASRFAASRRPGVPGPRIGVLVEPGADWLAVMLGIFQAGAIAVPLSPRYPTVELGHLLQDADASAVVVTRRLMRPQLPFAQLAVEPLLATPNATTAPPPNEDDVAMLLYTSGTTGRPKGVRLRHRQLAHQLNTLIDCWQLRGRRSLLHVLPLHHMHGIAIALLPCLAAGMTAHMLPRFEATGVWEALAHNDTFMAVPTMYHLLLDAYDAADDTTRAHWRDHAAQLSLATSGSAALPAAVASRWQALTGSIPLERWGMTEVGVGLANPLAGEQRRRGWVGRALPGIELRIVDDSGNACDPGDLWVRGPGVFDRYWRRADATAEAIVDGWFHTGDVVERDATGCVRIVGRRSVDIIKSGGYKLSALEVEEQLREHPAIADVAVVGLADERWGQIVAAAVVVESTTSCTPSSLRAWAEQRLAGYKVPRRVVMVDALPRNAIGKVIKADVATLLR